VKLSPRTDRAFAFAVRLMADAVMINLAFLATLDIHFLWTLVVQGLDTASATTAFYEHLGIYLRGAWLLTAVCLLVFYLSGFYSRGRSYRGRYKALVVTQATCLAYLIMTALTHLLSEAVRIPRSILLVTWVVSVAFLVGSRLWTTMWRSLFSLETKREQRPDHQGIRSVLVIGGAGYIGSALLPKLLREDYRVRLLDLFLFGEEPIADVIDHPNLEIMRADFRQVDKVVEAVQDMDAVIHLGGIVGDPACALNENLTIEVNLMATRMVAEVAKGCGVRRFIFASTCSVYGASDLIMDENSALRPVSLYAQSKVASEKVLMQVSNGDFAPVIIRFGTVYGFSGRVRFDLVVNLLTAKAVFDKKITLFGGDQWRPFIHVDDAAQGIFAALKAPAEQVQRQVFNMGSDEQNHTLAQVAELIKEQVPDARILDSGTDGDRRNYRVTFAKARRILGFVPKWTLQRGITQVLEAIRGRRVGDYRNAKYSNVKFLSEEGASLLGCQNGWVDELINGEPAMQQPKFN